MVRPSFDQVDYGESPEPADGSDILQALTSWRNEVYLSARQHDFEGYVLPCHSIIEVQELPSPCALDFVDYDEPQEVNDD